MKKRESTTELYEKWKESVINFEWYEALRGAWKNVLKRNNKAKWSK